ncbi:MAG: peptidase MA family metallohydrolase [Thermomicrobiales bacterium]
MMQCRFPPTPTLFARVLSAMMVGLLIGSLLAFLQTPLALGQTPVASPVAGGLDVHTEVAVDFPTGLHFKATLAAPGGRIDITTDEVDLIYQTGNEDAEHLLIVSGSDLTQSSATTITVDTAIDLQQAGIPPGLELTFWWQVVRQGSRIAASTPERTLWFDNRQDWHELSSSQVQLHYFDLDPSFAQQILDSAQRTVTELESSYSLERSRMLSIWVYPDQASFRGSLPANSRDTIAGGSFIGYSLITAVIPNGSTSEIGRIIPHEVSHQVLFQVTQNPFTVLPVWFDEGMATHTQIGGTSAYMGMVINASRNDALFNLPSLAASFPFVPSQATLAYAVSWSAIDYIQQTYGEKGIASMIDAYKSGVSGDQVIQNALGITMEQLNADWKAWVASQTSS